MSTSTSQETSTRRQRQSAEHATPTNGDASVDHVVVPFGENDFEIDGQEISFPVKYVRGMIHTDHSALCAQVYTQRQFQSNMNANAAARARRFAAATTDAARAENMPYTVAELLALWNDYVPNPGRERVSSMEKLRSDAAYAVWEDLVREHNACIDKGVQSTVWAKQTLKRVIPGRAIKMTDGTTQTVADYREINSNNVLNTTSARVQALLQSKIDEMLALRNAAKTAQEGVVFSGEGDDFS